MPDGLIRTTLGHWLVAGDRSLSGLIIAAATFEYPENLKVLTLVAPFIPEGGVVVNAGACIGDHTVTYSQIVGVEGCVYAFEPQPDSYAALVKNTARLRNVVTINAALGSQPDEAAVFSSSPTNIGASCLGLVDGYPDFPTSLVRVTTLDLALADVPHVDFIHLDAEGMEPFIVDGAAAIIARDHPVLLVEVTPSKIRLRKILLSEADRRRAARQRA